MKTKANKQKCSVFSSLTQFLRLPHVGVHTTVVKGFITACIRSVISISFQQLVFGFLCFLNQICAEKKIRTR